MSENRRAAKYCPQVFDTPTMDAAKAIILTNEGEGADTETRGKIETPFLGKLIAESLRPAAASVVIDYGCGIGRLSKELIEQTGCFVVGVDISAEMCVLAKQYVASDRFMAVSPAQLGALVGSRPARGSRDRGRWVLRHCLSPVEDVRRIKRALARLQGTCSSSTCMCAPCRP